MAISDLSITKAKELFDINVWAHIQVTQAFLPLLMRSENGIVVNHTSSASVLNVPFQSACTLTDLTFVLYPFVSEICAKPFAYDI
jgi:short-subunit dehydrogenase